MRPLLYRQPVYRPETMVSHFIYLGIAVIFWAAVIFGIVMLINHFVQRHEPTQPIPQDPIAIAKVRYAKGEITKDEFTRLKKDLS